MKEIKPALQYLPRVEHVELGGRVLVPQKVPMGTEPEIVHGGEKTFLYLKIRALPEDLTKKAAP